MNPLILALDTADITEAHGILNMTRDYIGMIKIGPELWSSVGPESLTLGSNFNIPIFLDLKLHDTPVMVGKTLDAIAKHNSPNQEISFVSVHALGGREMLKEAILAIKNTNIQIAVITMMTSLDKDDMSDFGLRGFPGTKTVDWAAFAREIGAENFICSPTNLGLMRSHLDVDGFRSTLICPGIRMADAEKDDQKRTKPISFAMKMGADWVIVGRPITKATDPRDAARDLAHQIQRARK